MECTIQSHFKTQLPYLITVFAVSLTSYIVCGFTKNNLLASWIVGLSTLLLGMVGMYFLYPHLKSSQKDMYYDNEDDMKKGVVDQRAEDEFVKSFMDNDSLI